MTQPAGIAAFLLLGVAAVAFAAYYFFAPANQEPYRHSNNRDHSYRDYVPPQQTQTRSDNTNGNIRRRRRNSKDYCAICLTILKGELEECSCYHVYHANCIRHWINLGNNTCPQCRAIIKT